MARPKNEELIEPKALKVIGRAVGGTHWQSDIAREIKCSKSLLTRAVGGSRWPDEEFLMRFRGTMISRIDGIGALLNTEGLPFADDPKTARAMKMISDACALLRSQQAKR